MARTSILFPSKAYPTAWIGMMLCLVLAIGGTRSVAAAGLEAHIPAAAPGEVTGIEGNLISIRFPNADSVAPGDTVHFYRNYVAIQDEVTGRILSGETWLGNGLVERLEGTTAVVRAPFLELHAGDLARRPPTPVLELTDTQSWLPQGRENGDEVRTKNRTSSNRTIRHFRIRKKVQGTAQRPRLAVYPSLQHFEAQVIDDFDQMTLLGVSTKSREFQDKTKLKQWGNVEAASLLGKWLAEKAKEKGIQRVVFDRAGFLYHGRVKAFADSARDSGLQF
jgi:large subunit ribosomal protein L18